MRFFIQYDTHQDGPFDLFSMIRKIRNSELPPNALVLEEQESHAVHAENHPQLESFFQELNSSPISEPTDPLLQPSSALEAIKQGWSFFQHHQVSTLCSGIYLLLVISFGLLFNGLLPDALSFISLLLTWVIAHFLFGGFFLSILHIYRGEKPSLIRILQSYISYFRPLLAYGIIVGLLSAIGGALLIVPGLIVLTFFIFAAPLIIEEHYSVRAALTLSKRIIRQHDRKLFELILTLIVLNFIAALFFVFPLLITLPMTVSILVELYERLHFTQ